MPDFRVPYQVEGYGDENYARDLFDLACTIPEKRIIVELGTFDGFGAICLAQSLRTVVTIDSFEGEVLPWARFSHLAGTYEESARWNIREAALNGMDIHIVKGKTADYPVGIFEAVLEEPPIGLLFVDAGHDFANVVADLKQWAPRVASKGLIVMDDWNSHPEVRPAAEQELSSEAWTLREVLHDRLAVFERNT